MTGPEPRLVLTRSHPWYTSLQETVKLRDKVYEKRLKLEIQAGNYNEQWQHTSKRLADFLDCGVAFVQLLSESVDVAGREKLELKWQELQKSVGYLQKWHSQGKAELDALTDLEGALWRKEDQLYSELKTMVAVPDKPAHDLDSDTESGDTLNYERLSDSSVEEDHPLVQEYHDSLGDLKLIREQIFNADADHLRQEYQRDQAAQSGHLDHFRLQKYEQAYQKYVIKRAENVRQFFELKKEVETLRTQCQKRGLVIEDFELPPFLDLSGRVDKPINPRTSGPLRINKKWNPDSFLVFGGLDKQNRILLWRDKVRRAVEEEDSSVSRSSSKSRILGAKSPSRSSTPVQAKIKLPPPPPIPSSPAFSSQLAAHPTFPPPPPPYPAFPLEQIMPEPEIQDDTLPTMDEYAINFGRFQDDRPLKRRYSEPNLHEALEKKAQVTTQFLLEDGTSKSETSLEMLRRAANQILVDPVELSLTQSTRRHCQSRNEHLYSFDEQQSP